MLTTLKKKAVKGIQAQITPEKHQFLYNYFTNSLTRKTVCPN